MSKIPRNVMQKSGSRLTKAPAVPEKGTYSPQRERVRTYNAFSTRRDRPKK
jgi:hypothetical protein